jgi:predicted PurR-regulated permease PerM
MINTMWQEVAIIFVAAGIIVYAGYRLYRFLTRCKKNSCNGCPFS